MVRVARKYRPLSPPHSSVAPGGAGSAYSCNRDEDTGRRQRETDTRGQRHPARQRPGDPRGGHRGETDPERLADCTTGRLKAGRADIVTAEHGRVKSHHRFLLKLHLAQIDALTAAAHQVEHQADEVCATFGRRRVGAPAEPSGLR